MKVFAWPNWKQLKHARTSSQDDDDVGGLLRWKGVRRTRTRTRTAGNCMCGECTCETFTPVEMSMGRKVVLATEEQDREQRP